MKANIVCDVAVKHCGRFTGSLQVSYWLCVLDALFALSLYNVTFQKYRRIISYGILKQCIAERHFEDLSVFSS